MNRTDYEKEARYIAEKFYKKDWDKLDKTELRIWTKKFSELNTYEISVPALKDPSLAPKGKTGLIISFLAEYDLFKKLKKSGMLNEFKNDLIKS